MGLAGGLATNGIIPAGGTTAVAGFVPADLGMLAANGDPINFTNNPVLTAAGTVCVVKLKVPAALSVTNILLNIQTAGATLTSAQCLAALYQNNTLLGTTADQSVAWASAGFKTMAIVGGPVAVAAGEAYGAFVYNGTTAPKPSAGGNVLFANQGATTVRWATANTGVTTAMPGTLGALTGVTTTWWAGLS